MTEVSFEEERSLPVAEPGAHASKKGFIGLLIRTGLVRTESGANIILIIIMLIALTCTVVLAMNMLGDQRTVIPPIDATSR